MPTTPIVFALVADPVSAGLVTSFANPGGDVTGLTNMNVLSLSGKRAETHGNFPCSNSISACCQTPPTRTASASAHLTRDPPDSASGKAKTRNIERQGTQRISRGYPPLY